MSERDIPPEVRYEDAAPTRDTEPYGLEDVINEAEIRAAEKLRSEESDYYWRQREP